MKKILGNLFLLLSTPIFALSSASVNQTWFYLGEEITLTINSDGNKVNFPLIDNIAGYPVLRTSNAQNINIINNKRSKQSSKSYVFKPLKNLHIPAYTLMVDGVEQSTQPIQITFRKPTETKVGDDYILQMKVDKATFFLGDKANLSVIFKVKKSLSSANQITLSEPEVKDLLFIKSSKIVRSADENYHIHTLNYKVSADNFGAFNIPNLTATIGNQNTDVFASFFDRRQPTQQQKIFSNPLALTVKPLPDALRIFGNFSLKAVVDKSQVKQGDAVNLTVSIEGEGNFEDIQAFNIEIDNATIYSDDALITYKDWQQKFAIIGGENFIIPSLKLDYFDKITQTKKTINTQPINIQIDKSNLAVKTAVETTATPNSKAPINNKLKYYYLLLGLLVGTLIGFLSAKFNNRKKQNKQQDLIKQVKSSRGDKALFDLLLPLNLSQLEPILQQLEANLYKGEHHKINKKNVISLIQ